MENQEEKSAPTAEDGDQEEYLSHDSKQGE